MGLPALLMDSRSGATKSWEPSPVIFVLSSLMRQTSPINSNLTVNLALLPFSELHFDFGLLISATVLAGDRNWHLWSSRDLLPPKIGFGVLINLDSSTFWVLRSKREKRGTFGRGVLGLFRNAENG